MIQYCNIIFICTSISYNYFFQSIAECKSYYDRIAKAKQKLKSQLSAYIKKEKLNFTKVDVLY